MFAVVGQIGVERRARKGAIAVVIMLRPCGSDDPQILRHQPVHMQRTQRRQQHALGKITRRTKEQKLVSGDFHSAHFLFIIMHRTLEPGQEIATAVHTDTLCKTRNCSRNGRVKPKN